MPTQWAYRQLPYSFFQQEPEVGFELLAIDDARMRRRNSAAAIDRTAERNYIAPGEGGAARWPNQRVL